MRRKKIVTDVEKNDERREYMKGGNKEEDERKERKYERGQGILDSCKKNDT